MSVEVGPDRRWERETGEIEWDPALGDWVWRRSRRLRRKKEDASWRSGGFNAQCSGETRTSVSGDRMDAAGSRGRTTRAGRALCLTRGPSLKERDGRPYSSQFRGRASTTSFIQLCLVETRRESRKILGGRVGRMTMSAKRFSRSCCKKTRRSGN